MNDLIRLQGRVTSVLPNANFRIKLEDGPEVLGFISGKIRRANINILMGDLVDIEMSPYDTTKGRIVYRYKK
jgi:translation initiation factor IF-1